MWITKFFQGTLNDNSDIDEGSKFEVRFNLSQLFGGNSLPLPFNLDDTFFQWQLGFNDRNDSSHQMQNWWSKRIGVDHSTNNDSYWAPVVFLQSMYYVFKDDIIDFKMLLLLLLKTDLSKAPMDLL